MPDEVSIPEPVFPEIPASNPTVNPPIPEEVFNQWFCGPVVIRSNPDSSYDLEVVWLKGNATKLNGEQTNNILRNITSMPALVEQLGQEWLDENPDVVAIMPQFLGVLAKIAQRQGVL